MKTQEQMDAEANYFALCLLMPTDLLKEEVEKVGGVDLVDGRNVAELARRFQVSEPLMAFRLGQVMETK